MDDKIPELKEHREELAARIEEGWKALLEVLTYWTDHDLPSDTLYDNEYPFEVELEEQLARMAHAVEHIRRHNDQGRVCAPDFDTVEALRFDGTLRGLDGRPVGQGVTWEEVDARLAERSGPTMTAGQIRAALVNVPDDRYVIAYGAADYLNIKSVEVPDDEIAAVVNTMDDFDDRQW